jgi:hypothetical protein
MRFLTKINGILKLLEAITSFTGQPNQIVGTDSSGKLAKNLLSLDLDDLQNVSATLPQPGDILFYDSGIWTSRKPPLSWVWTVYGSNITLTTPQAFRFSSMSSAATRFRSPVTAKLQYAVSSTTDGDDFQIEIYRNGGLVLTLTHPLTISTQVHSLLNFTILSTDEIYVLFKLIGTGDVGRVAFDMFFQESL